MVNFSEKTLSYLQSAGWSENYKADMQEFILRAKSKNCIIPPIVVNFIQNFGRLKIQYISELPPDLIMKYGMSNSKEFHLDPEQVDEYCEDFSSLAGRLEIETLYAIGEWNGHIILVMSADGWVYAITYDETIVYFVGNSGEEAIENICTHQLIPRLDI